MTDGRRNLLPNPALAVDATGWSAVESSGSLGTAARTAVTGMDRSWAFQYTQTAVGQVDLVTPAASVTPGQAYSGTVQFRVSTVPPVTTVALRFFDSGGTSILNTSYSPASLTANVPLRLGMTVVAPAGAVTCSLRVILITAASPGSVFAATAARIEQSDDPNLDYADGDTSGWSWLGTAGASPSRNPVGLDTARLNSVTNPYLASSDTGWAWWKFNGVASPTAARTSVTGMDRGAAYRVTSAGVHDFAAVAPPVAVTPGQTHTATAQARFSAVPSTAGLVVVWLKSDSTYLSATTLSEQSLITANVAYRSRTAVDVPATAAYACVGFRWATSTATPTVDVTAARLELGRDRSFTYADGLTDGWTWDGAAGTSTSRSVPLTPVLPGYATSTESAPAIARSHARPVNATTAEVDAALAVGRLRGGALVETLVDTFEAPELDPQWVNGGGGVLNSRLYVSCSHNAGVPIFTNVRSSTGYAWSGSSLLFEIGQMPGVASTDTAFAQMWIMDPAPSNTVDRLGFEYRVAANALDLIGQTGASYSPIGTTTTLTYAAATHRWLRITHTGSSIVWATSPDGLTWTTQRTLATPPAWTTKTTLRVSFEAYRTSGTNDLFLVDSVNIAPLRIVRPVRGLSAVGRSYSF